MATQRLSHERLIYPMRNGDCMLRRDFHALYSRMPDGYRAELIGGVVFEPSPLSWPHSQSHTKLGYLLETYSMSTDGTAVGDNATIMLSDDDEVQPDLVMRILEEQGGKSRLTKGKKKKYVKGAPELVAEIAFSSQAIDLHLKKRRYQLAGVLEYIVLCLEPKRLYWFDLQGGSELPVHDGVVRSVVFPGLWVHVEGLLELNQKLTLSTLRRGVKSKEHQLFVKDLAKRRS